MSAVTESVERYRARGWCTIPVHRPDLDEGTCSCGQPTCPKPGKHPDARFWPDGSADPEHFAGRNLGVRLGPVSRDLADVDLDCAEAVLAGSYLLPTTNSAFGRDGHVTHALYTVADRAAVFAKLQDPVRSGDGATIVELRWPEWDETEQRFKNLQTVFPPSLHFSGDTLEWVRDEEPAQVVGADLCAAVCQIGAAVLLARYAKPKERHALVLLIANLLVRAGWADDAKAVLFIIAVFAARNDSDKVAKIANGEGAGAVTDARKRMKNNKPMTGLPALRAMLAPALDNATADHVVARVKEWLGVPDPPAAHANVGAGPAPGGKPGAGAAPRYAPLPLWRPFPVEHLPGPVRDFVLTVSKAMRCDPTFVALPALAACAGMIGATRVIRLKKSWHEPAMLWAAVVGDSGTLKTPPYKRAVAPVVAMQAAHLKAHRAAAETHRAELREYERTKRRSKDDDPGDPPAPPPCIRVYSRDTTIEALGGLLVDNKTRFLIGRDELSGWLSSFNQYKAKGGSDLANWLELHGLGTLCVDRKTGDPKTIFVSDVGVSLCGGIQPGVLRLALTPQHFSAGVPARLLFAYAAEAQGMDRRRHRRSRRGRLPPAHHGTGGTRTAHRRGREPVSGHPRIGRGREGRVGPILRPVRTQAVRDRGRTRRRVLEVRGLCRATGAGPPRVPVGHGGVGCVGSRHPRQRASGHRAGRVVHLRSRARLSDARRRNRGTRDAETVRGR